MFQLNAMAHNDYNVGAYEKPYASTYNYIPFKSTSPYAQNTNYTAVKPLNFDGTVSIEYTTYKGVYRPRYVKNGLETDPDDIPIGAPIGEPIAPLLIIMFAYLSYRRLKIQR